MPRKGTRNKKFKRIFDMGPDYVQRLDAMLYKGDFPKDIVAIMQKDWGFFKDIKPATMVRQLTNYRKDIIRSSLPSNTQNPDGETKGDILATKKIAGKIDAVNQLENLCLMQKERLAKIYMQEQKMPTVMSAVRSEIVVFSKLLDQFAGLQMDLGILQRVPRMVKGEIDLYAVAHEQEQILEDKISTQDQRTAATHEVFALLGEIVDAEILESDSNDN